MARDNSSFLASLLGIRSPGLPRFLRGPAASFAMLVAACACVLLVALASGSSASASPTTAVADPISSVRLGEGIAEVGDERSPFTVVAQASEQAAVDAVAPAPRRISTVTIAGLAFAVVLLLLVLFLIRRALRSRQAAAPVAPRAAVKVERQAQATATVPEPEIEERVAKVEPLTLHKAAPHPVDPKPSEPRSPDRIRGEKADTVVAVEIAADRLISDGASRAIFVSPEGDEGAAVAVLVARELADAGLRILLVDLTIAGAASIPMLESVSLPGLTDILAGKAQLADIIHADHYSECQVIPVGTADPVRAMRSVDRLPIILDSLTAAYDIIVLECGPTHASGIRKLINSATDVIVSVIEPGSASVVATAAALRENGFDDVMLVTPSRRPVRFRSG
ncbi:MAG: tyrosine-protein kinase family protein [Rhizobiaceae bacterium]|nr:tyrosine-protein kinase family protein [Rhizobiaceae bacterium]